MERLVELLDASAARHHHLCPRQVLGIRLGLYAGEILGLALPQTGKQLFAIAETDGCGMDGISVATGCWPGGRTMRIEDFGKVAATFVDTQTGRAIRISPSRSARLRAGAYAAEAASAWQAQLIGYQHVPAEELFDLQEVRLLTPIEQIIGQPGLRAICTGCGEEIMNGREIIQDGVTLCRACAGGSYYDALQVITPAVLAGHALD